MLHHTTTSSKQSLILANLCLTRKVYNLFKETVEPLLGFRIALEKTYRHKNFGTEVIIDLNEC